MSPAPVKGRSASAALTQRKKMRRQWITFVRMCRYGVNNFSRNAWLTTAALAVMTVTLLIVFVSLTARNVFNDTLVALRKELDVSFYLADNVSESEKDNLISALKQQPNVNGVRYLTSAEAKEVFAKDNADEVGVLEALEIAGDITDFPATIRIDVNDPSKLEDLDALFATEQFKAAQNPNPDLVPSLQGGSRDVIDTIATWAFWAERGGLALSLISVIISVLIIFNTIRMAIFTRRDEIQMMKLIGADKNFIQGPFIVEAIMYGVFAAVVTTALSYTALMFINRDSLATYGIVAEPTFRFLESYPSLVIVMLILVGAVIGVVSSFLAIRRYLKV